MSSYKNVLQDTSCTREKQQKKLTCDTNKKKISFGFLFYNQTWLFLKIKTLKCNFSEIKNKMWKILCGLKFSLKNLHNSKQIFSGSSGSRETEFEHEKCHHCAPPSSTLFLLLSLKNFFQTKFLYLWNPEYFFRSTLIV